MNLGQWFIAVVGWVIGIAGLTVTVVTTRKSTKKPILVSSVERNSLLFNPGRNLSGVVSLRIGETTVPNANQMLITIHNIGDSPLTPSLWHGPLCVQFEEGCSVLYEAIVSTKPPDLPPVLYRANENAVCIEPLLMNPGDRFQLQILTDTERPAFRISSRIEGVVAVRDIDFVRPRRRKRTSFGVLFWIALILLTVIVFLATRSRIDQVIKSTGIIDLLRK